ncbi:hypothetical protein CP965_01985 [Halarcobacter mediterraneus]|uniref:t-SNARE coiled-coil homology domain-containing protein n=1 Tax=Halarcobacter mediterraneus TaxID=2023153 RepID=A0A4Q1B1L2_9BACT|nr:hypothetical protein [Halarcobacter mediterraneus]RXK14241.1 hypothetical protein CP965_01985 [Halarcobacter mediterraneus]
MKILILFFIFITLCFSDCPTTPTINILGGYDYQGMAGSNSDCQSIANDNSDGLGFVFSNPNLDDTCPGFCYYNTPEPIIYPQYPNTTGNGEGEEISDLIPYLDEVEYVNLNIVDELNTLNSNVESATNQVNQNTQTIDSSLNNVDNTLTNLNTTLETLNTKLDDIGNSEDDDSLYDGLTDDFEINPSIDGELSNFQGDIENTLTNSFDTYSNVFGLGGYGSAPSNINFSLLGKTYTVFDIQVLAQYIEQIRNIFLIVAYLFGIILVFKGV